MSRLSKASQGFEDPKKHIYFLDNFCPEILGELLKKSKNFSLIDLGCGDGRMLFRLEQRGLLKEAKEVVGVDISKERIRRLKEIIPFAKRITSDVQNLRQIQSNLFDIAISSQVIEHVLDEKKMLSEVKRILKPGGYFYVSTVIKKWYSFWIYWSKGFRLNPTHLREYRSEIEFISLLKNEGFEVAQWRTNPPFYPLLDLFLRLLVRIGFKISPDFYLKHLTLLKMRKIGIKPIGYKEIDVLALKR